jgi:hypothetical protein
MNRLPYLALVVYVLVTACSAEVTPASVSALAAPTQTFPALAAPHFAASHNTEAANILPDHACATLPLQVGRTPFQVPHAIRQLENGSDPDGLTQACRRFMKGFKDSK